MTKHKLARPAITKNKKTSRYRKHPVLSDDKFDCVYNADKTLNLRETVKHNLGDDDDSSNEG